MPKTKRSIQNMCSLSRTMQDGYEPPWRPKIGQTFRAYHMLGGRRHYHRLCPLVCTGRNTDQGEVIAGEIVMDVAIWRFERG